jgi:hypothetical protein
VGKTGNGWGVGGDPTPARPPAKGIRYSGGAKKKKGCWLLALALISAPIGAVYGIVEVLT